MAGLEIERKFLVDRLPADLGPGEPIEQGYLAIGPEGLEVRIRHRAGRAFLTIKKGLGEVRAEEELEIDEDRFRRLWPLAQAASLVKTRHVVALDGGLNAELDVYAGSLEGLATVEVEFPDRAASSAFHPPAWFGREVTNDARYKNQRLARDGLMEHPSRSA